MNTRLKFRHGRKFPPRISHEELYDRTQQRMNECGVDNHAQAEFTTKIAKEVVGRKEYKYESVQPELKLRDDIAWRSAFTVAQSFLKDFQMNLTLDSLTVELEGNVLPTNEKILKGNKDSVSLLEKMVDDSVQVPFSERVKEFSVRNKLPPTSEKVKNQSLPQPMDQKAKITLLNQGGKATTKQESKKPLPINISLSGNNTEDNFSDLEYDVSQQMPPVSPAAAPPSDNDDLDIENISDEDFDSPKEEIVTKPAKSNLAQQPVKPSTSQQEKPPAADVDDFDEDIDIDIEVVDNEPKPQPEKDPAYRDQIIAVDGDSEEDLKLDDEFAADDDQKEIEKAQKLVKSVQPKPEQTNQDSVEDFDVDNIDIDVDIDDQNVEEQKPVTDVSATANQANQQSEEDFSEKDEFDIGSNSYTEESPVKAMPTAPTSTAVKGGTNNDNGFDDFPSEDDDLKQEKSQSDENVEDFNIEEEAVADNDSNEKKPTEIKAQPDEKIEPVSGLDDDLNIDVDMGFSDPEEEEEAVPNQAAPSKPQVIEQTNLGNSKKNTVPTNSFDMDVDFSDDVDIEEKSFREEKPPVLVQTNSAASNTVQTKDDDDIGDIEFNEDFRLSDDDDEKHKADPKEVKENFTASNIEPAVVQVTKTEIKGNSAEAESFSDDDFNIEIEELPSDGNEDQQAAPPQPQPVQKPAEEEKHDDDFANISDEDFEVETENLDGHAEEEAPPVEQHLSADSNGFDDIEDIDISDGNNPSPQKLPANDEENADFDDFEVKVESDFESGSEKGAKKNEEIEDVQFSDGDFDVDFDE